MNCDEDSIAELIPWREAELRAKEGGITVQFPGREIDIDWHRKFITDFDLWLVLEGEAEIIFEDGRQQTVSRGSCIWLRPSVPFGLRVSNEAPTHTAWMHFDFVDPAGEVIPCERVAVPQQILEVGSIAFFEAAFRHLTTLDSKAASSEAEVALVQGEATSLLRALLHEYELASLRPARMPHASLQYRMVVEAVQSWLEQHPDRPVTAGELARRHGYSLPHFSRIFRKTLGKSPTELIIEARVRRAKRLLLHSTLNISEIATSLGYEEVFYFSKQFKKATGLSPLAFRKVNL